MSENIGKLIVTALISYVATNADDLIILMNFFTEVSIGNSNMKVRHVFIGQYLGFFILLLISLIGYLISFVLPAEMLGFLGFLPIFIGIKNFIEIIFELYNQRHGTIDDILPTDPISTVQLEMIRYRKDFNGEIIYELKKREEQQENPLLTNQRIKSNLLKYLTHIFTIETLKITSITVANGGDNIAIYTPLFAQAFKWQIVVYIIIFLLMVFIWLIISYYFINYRPILNLAQKYARYIVPIVFIGIGIYIIVTSDCFSWLIQAIKTKNFKNG
jgi:cadmium resistance protein CadD (predicted permease)